MIDFLSMRDVGMNAVGSPQTAPSGADIIGDILENSFCEQNTPFDFPIPSSVLSTIAIALSPNGETVATTHGDHTVKIHDYESGIVKQVFVGHPRTPWTVKYHPYNSDIIASGCLGFQVRVWDLKHGVHLTTIRYDFSIISLSFHPFLPILAVASGPKLYMFNWQDNLSKHEIETINEATERFRKTKNHSVDFTGFEAEMMRADVNSNKSPTSILSSVGPGSGYGVDSSGKSSGSGADSSIQYHVVQHCRSIRAVLFHPSGKYLLTAAPDPPRSQGACTACRLYFYPVDCLRVGSEGSRKLLESNRADLARAEPPASPSFDNAGHEVLQLIHMPYILEQIHLYSDGGLDISEDGDHLVTCSILPDGVIGGAFGTNSSRKRAQNGHIGNSSAYIRQQEASVSNAKRNFDQLLLTNPTPPRPDIGVSSAGSWWPMTGFASLVDDDATHTPAAMNSRAYEQPNLSVGMNSATDSAFSPDLPRESRFPRREEFQQSGGSVMPGGGANTTGLQHQTRPTSAVPHQNVRRFPYLNDSHIVYSAHSSGSGSSSLPHSQQSHPHLGSVSNSSPHPYPPPPPLPPPLPVPPVPVDFNFPVFDGGLSRGHDHRRENDGDDDESDDNFDDDDDTDDQVTMDSQWTGAGDLLMTTTTRTATRGSSGEDDSHVRQTVGRWISLPPPIGIHNHAGAGADAAGAFSSSVSPSVQLPLNTMTKGSHDESQGQDSLLSRQTRLFPRQIDTHMSATPKVLDASRAVAIPKLRTIGYLCLFKLANVKTYASEASDRDRSDFSSSTGVAASAFSSPFVVRNANSDDSVRFTLSPIVPVLCAAKPLPGNLMKAITSAKLSPSNKCCMIGFGVRTEGVVFGHTKSDVACEIIDLSNMLTTCILTDDEDEVNIAQFHPIAGNGILYGTKKGRIRKYQRSSQLSMSDDEEEDGDEVVDDFYEYVGGEMYMFDHIPRDEGTNAMQS